MTSGVFLFVVSLYRLTNLTYRDNLITPAPNRLPPKAIPAIDPTHWLDGKGGGTPEEATWI